MKKLYKLMGTALLGIAALIAVVGPASINSIAVEDMPESIKRDR